VFFWLLAASKLGGRRAKKKLQNGTTSQISPPALIPPGKKQPRPTAQEGYATKGRDRTKPAQIGYGEQIERAGKN
jgi:hypothetical protein